MRFSDPRRHQFAKVCQCGKKQIFFDVLILAKIPKGQKMLCPFEKKYPTPDYCVFAHVSIFVSRTSSGMHPSFKNSS